MKLDKQIGGDHYKNMRIQPIEFISANQLNFFQGNIIKYTCRAPHKHGIVDIDKAIHYLELWRDSMTGPVVSESTQAMIDRQCEDCD